MQKIIVLDYVGLISAFGAVWTFIFGAYKYISVRNRAHYWKEFEIYHELVKKLVEPEEKDKTKYIDRQAAIIFELRYFKRYYSYSLRMLQHLKKEWEQFPRLIEEIDLTIIFLERGFLSRVFANKLEVDAQKKGGKK